MHSTRAGKIGASSDPWRAGRRCCLLGANAPRRGLARDARRPPLDERAPLASGHRWPRGAGGRGPGAARRRGNETVSSAHFQRFETAALGQPQRFLCFTATLRRARARASRKRLPMLCNDMSRAKTLKAPRAGRYVWRDAAGRFQGIIIHDPVVRPKGISVRTIKRAVEKTTSSKPGRSSHPKVK